MTVLIVLLMSLFLFRGMGALGFATFPSWPAATRHAVAVMLLFTASAHFTSMKEDLIRMVPRWAPRPRAVVFATGICEILGAIGLLLPMAQRITGMALIPFLVAVFPANGHAAGAGVTLRGQPATPVWVRAPMQLLFIALTWWSTQ
jgi:uncharacterized membrane protein